jgi:high-affinity iron transporter
LKSALEGRVQSAIGNGQDWGLTAVAFLAVFREGVETALLLSAVAFTTDATGALVGALLGLALAALLGTLIYASTIRLNLRMFFSVTSLLLLAFAAGLLARGVHEFQEAGVLASLNEHVWDLSGVLSEESLLGQVAAIVFGYQASPSFESVIVYAAYWLATLVGVRWWLDRRLGRSTPQRAASSA